MIKLAIVDDELLMSEFLKQCVDYDAMGITVTGVFCDGAAALEAFRREMPDIVITDIKMPEVDGVELLRECSSLGGNVRFVVISNYQDFHVVKNVLGMGVCDYILKTEFDVDDYENVLRGIVRQIQGDREPDMTDFMVKNHELKKLFWNNMKSLSDSRYSLRISGSRVRMGIIFIVNHDEIVKEQWEMSKELMQIGLANYFEETLTKFGNGEIIFNSYDELILIFSGDTAEEETERFLEEAAAFLDEYFQLAVFCVTGLCEFSGEPMRNKSEELRKNKDLCFVAEKCVLTETEIKLKYQENFAVYDEIKLCWEWLENLEFDRVIDRLNEIKTKKFSVRSVGAVYEFIETLTVKINRIAEGNGIALADRGKESAGNLEHISEAADALMYKLKAIAEGIPQRRDKHSIEEYMRKNYAKKLTLNEVADVFNYEYNYFSKYFLRLTGKPFRKYLSDLRLETARELIIGTDFKLNEIAKMVGYSNYEHFSRAYKKKFGKWPKDMRMEGY